MEVGRYGSGVPMYRWLTSENDDVAWRYCEYDCKRNKETSNPGDVSRIQSMLTCHSYISEHRSILVTCAVYSVYSTYSYQLPPAS
jgi:hypothetical protein